MNALKLWNVKVKFNDGSECVKQYRGVEFTVGTSPKATLRLAGAPAEIALTVKGIESGKVEVHKIANATLELSEISASRVKNAVDPEHWGESLKDDGADKALWHFHEGTLVECVYLEAKAQKLRLKAGMEIEWNPEQSDELVVYFESGDLRSLRFEKSTSGGFKAGFDDELFVLTSVPNRQAIERLEGPHENKEGPSFFKRILVGMCFSWILFLLLMNFGTAPEMVAEEVLSADQTKVVVEKATRPVEKAKGGGDGQVGGGGVEYVEEKDPRGGSGISRDEVVVKDTKALFGGLGMLSALSALDEGMKSGKVKSAGFVGLNKNPNGSPGGMLGALAALGGKGTGSNGLGIGGVGTKGFGGGGGGGKGAGFGTGVGNGLGKGDGLRNISFDNSGTDVRGGLEKSEVDAVVQENISQIRFCYNRALRQNPKLQGKIISFFTIGAEGGVKISRVKESTMASPEVENCVKERISGWKFPKPRGGGEVVVSYPFLLKQN